MKIIYLPLEIKARELEGKVLIALEAALNGYKVVVGHMSKINSGIKEGVLKKGIYFDKSITKGKENKFRDLKERGFKIVSQDEEGLQLSSEYKRFLAHRSSKEAMELVDEIFCWGSEDKISWDEMYPEYERKIFATGSHRVDYWRKDFLPYFKEQTNEILKKYKKFILISCTFGLSVLSNGRRTRDEIIEQARRQGRIKTPEDIKKIDKKIKDNQALFYEFVKLIEYIANEYKSINVVIRPHPAEKMEGWKRIFGKYKNVFIVFEGGISNWVRSSLAVVHNSCTTGLEAYICGVPVIAYDPNSKPREVNVPNAVSLRCESKEMVSAALKDILSNASLNKNEIINSNIIEKKFSNLAGSPAAKRIIDKISLLDMSEESSFNVSLITRIRGYRRILHRNAYRKIKGENKILRKFPGLKIKEIENIKNRLTTLNESYRECRIRKLYDEIYIIDK